MRLSRSSSFTRRARRRSSEKVLRRSSPSVRGRLMRTPEYFPKLYAEDAGFGLRLSGFNRFPRCSLLGLLKPEARKPKPVLVDVAVSAGLFAGVGGALQVGDDGFEIADE